MPHRWSSAAQIRREQIESGRDVTFNRVFLPYYTSAVNNLGCRSLLEVGCGTGHLSKHLSQLIPVVHAIEPSPGMHEVSTAVLLETGVELVKCKLEDFNGDRKFDCVLSHLCGHVVAHLDSFLRDCSKWLADGGTFIFSLPHPCFWNDYQPYFDPKEFDYASECFTSATLTISKARDEKMTGLPFHHRPIGRYVESIVAARLVIRRFDEIFPPAGIQALYPAPWKRPHFCVFHVTLT